MLCSPWVFIAGPDCLCFPFLLVSLNKQVVISRAALIEKNVEDKCPCLPRAVRKHISFLDLCSLPLPVSVFLSLMKSIADKPGKQDVANFASAP